MVTPDVFRPRAPSLLVGSRLRNQSRKDRSLRMNHMVPLHRPEKKHKDFLNDIIHAENKVAWDTLKGAEKNLLEAMKSSCFFA